MPQEPFDDWIAELRQCDDVAVHRLWESYFQRLADLATRKLPRNGKRDFDEEDVALSALDSFCRGITHGKFPALNDEGNLWALLVLITSRKAAHRVRDGRAKKRGGGNLQGESAFSSGHPSEQTIGIRDVIATGPSAEYAKQVFEETEHLCHLLGDDGLREIAILKMEGLTNREIADRLGCVERTVERRLRLIRQLWADDCSTDCN